MTQSLDMDFLQQHIVVLVWLLLTGVIVIGAMWMKLADRWHLPKPMLWASAPWLGILAFWLGRDVTQSLTQGVAECPWRRCEIEATASTEPFQYWFFVGSKGFGFVVIVALICVVLWLAIFRRLWRARFGA